MLQKVKSSLAVPSVIYSFVEELRSLIFREEAEQKRLQELENQRRQKEEMEREQEMLRKKMIEERLVSFLKVNCFFLLC